MPSLGEHAGESRGRGKSPQAFRTISEVATNLDVPQHVLRFWESKFAQIKPMKRGGGRRYYRPEDVYLLRGIRNLLYREGYTIRGVQKVLRDAGTKTVVDVGRRDGDGGDEVPARDDNGSAPASTAATAAAGGLGGDQLARVQSAIDELKELKSLLESV